MACASNAGSRNVPDAVVAAQDVRDADPPRGDRPDRQDDQRQRHRRRRVVQMAMAMRVIGAVAMSRRVRMSRYAPTSQQA